MNYKDPFGKYTIEQLVRMAQDRKTRDQIKIEMLWSIVARLNGQLSEVDDYCAHKENTAINMAKDAALMAANDVLKLGAGRAKSFCDAFDSNMIEMLHMATGEIKGTVYRSEDEVEISYTKEKIDERIREIVGEKNFQPFEERYNWNEASRLMQARVPADIRKKGAI